MEMLIYRCIYAPSNKQKKTIKIFCQKIAHNSTVSNHVKQV